MTKTKARVFFVNRYFYPDESATSQILSDLLFELTGRGYEVHAICSRQLYGEPGALLPAEEFIRGVLVHRLWTTRFGRNRLLGRALDYISFYMTCTLALMRRLHSTDIVVAMTDPPLISIIAAVTAKCKRATLINWLQDIFPEVASVLGTNPLPSSFDALLRRLRNASLRSAGANVVLGSRMADYLRAQGLDDQTIHVIENWASAILIQPKPSADSVLRETLGLRGQFIVGYSGNLGRAHEYEMILDAAVALQGDESVTFLFIGGGFNMEALKAKTIERKLSRVCFLPYQPRESLEDSLAAADIHLVSLVPSLEGLIVPSKFYGILAAGRPIVFIGDPDGELARIIRSVHCGSIAGVGQGACLAAAIRELRDDDVQRTEMGLAARRLLSERYSVARAVDRWAELIPTVRSVHN